MKADYDSQGNSLSIDLADVDRWDYGEEINGDSICVVATRHDEPVNIFLLSPSQHLDLLNDAARQFDLDAAALKAAALAAMAVPDRAVTIDVDTDVLV